MKNYTIYNKSANKTLIHPKVGVWYSNSIDEAVDMLKACHEYLEAIKLEHLKNNFVIIDLDSGEEI